AHHTRRIWAAIDIVTQIDLHGASADKPSLILIDPPLHLQQQIEPPVNVTNNIYGEAVRPGWIARWRALRLRDFQCSHDYRQYREINKPHQKRWTLVYLWVCRDQ